MKGLEADCDKVKGANSTVLFLVFHPFRLLKDAQLLERVQVPPLVAVDPRELVPISFNFTQTIVQVCKLDPLRC